MKLGGKLTRIEFGTAIARDIMSNSRGATYAMALESTSKAPGGADGISLGHSEKIYLESVVVITVD